MAGRDLDRGRFLIPDPIPITLVKPTAPLPPGGAARSVTVERVQEQHAGETTEVNEYGSFVVTRKVFHLWLVECLALPPHEGYEILHPDGTVWAVKEVEVLAHGRRFRCHCMRRRNVS